MTDDNKPDNVLGDALASNYMLAGLTVRNWQASKTDRAASHDLTISKGATEDAAKVVKKLLVGAEKELKDVQSAYTAIRTYFYENSLPWTVATAGAMKGDRLVSVQDSMQFLGTFASLKNYADQMLDDFVTNHYEPAKQQAKANLGQMWNEDEYPSGDEVRRMFGAHLSLRPMPALQDFDRLAIPGKLANGLKELYERHTDVQIENAMTDLQGRIVTELARFITQMQKVEREEPTRMYASLHSNLQHLAKMCFNLNLRKAAALDDLSSGIKELTDGDVADYKGNVSLARAARVMAERLLESAKRPETFGLDGDDVQPEVEEEKEVDIAAREELEESVDELLAEAGITVEDSAEDVYNKLGESEEPTPDFDEDEVFF